MDVLNALNFCLKNLSTVTILLCVNVALATIIFISRLYANNKKSRGPWGLPILGYYPFLRKKNFHLHLIELSKKYGDVYMINLLGKNYLHVSSIKALREVSITKADCFSKRPTDFSLFFYVFKDGISFAEGESWKTLRKSLIQGMRELGIGAKEQMKGPLFDALQSTMNKLEESKTQPINICEILSNENAEVTRRLFLGENMSDETFKKFNQSYMTTIRPMIGLMGILVGNIARYLVLQWAPGFKNMSKSKEELKSILYKVLEDHKANFDAENVQDFIDIYLRDKKLRQDKGDPQAEFFTDSTLISSLMQLYGDGGVSIGLIICHYLKNLAECQEIQNEIFEEISREIGTDRLPTYEDRNKLPFTIAVIKELERTHEGAPVTLSLACTRETTVSGVFVPEGTTVLVNFHSIHHDPTTYKDPDVFNPKRFVSDGKKKSTEELPIFFGVGRRACPGESLVSTESFMFITTIIQRFIIRMADVKKEPNEEEDIFKIIITATPRPKV